MRLALTLAALLTTAQASAEMKLASPHNIPKINDTVETGGLVQLRESSPDPTFGVKGAQKGWIKSGETLRVLNVKNYISVHGTEIWLEVEKKEDANVKGWIFAGLAKEMAKGKSVVSVQLTPEAKAQAEEEARAAKAAADAMARSDALVRDEEF